MSVIKIQCEGDIPAAFFHAMTGAIIGGFMVVDVRLSKDDGKWTGEILLERRDNTYIQGKPFHNELLSSMNVINSPLLRLAGAEAPAPDSKSSPGPNS